METLEQFAQYSELIEVVRKFIFPNFLSKKRDLLKCYCRLLYCNNNDHSNAIERYFNVNNFYHDHYRNRDYDIVKCEVNDRKLTKNDILSLFRDTKKDQVLCFKKLLEELIFPQKLSKDDIEKEADRKVYPLNKTQLFEFVSFKFFKQFYFNLFMNTNFVKLIKAKHEIPDFSSLMTPPMLLQLNQTYNIAIIVKNDSNDIQLPIPRKLFIMYCGFSTLINDVEEQVDSITTPFVFNQKSSAYLLNCLINGYFINHKINKFTESDFEEIRQFFAYLQITFK